MTWVVDGAWARRTTPVVMSAVGLGVAAALTVAVVAQADRARGVQLGMVLSGVAALLSGLGVIVFSWRRGRGSAGERPRLVLGLGVMVWGAGQLLLGFQVTATGRRTAGLGDLVSSFCLPIMVLALISMPRRSRVSWPALRLFLDTMILAGAVTLLLWWQLLQPALPDPTSPGGAAVFGVVMASFDVSAAAMSALTWARDRRHGSAAVAIGLALQAVADITSLPAVEGGDPLPWVSGAIWCVAIPLVAAGIIEYATASVSDGAETLVEDLGESRAALISTVLALVLYATALSLPARHRWTAIAVILSSLVVVLLLTREALNTLVRNRMVRWLNSEALRDVLTGLPNRSGLTAKIRAVDLSRPWVLLAVDLDGFKKANDLLGPEAGDELIVQVGSALRRTAPADCLVARMGGDEFGVLAPGTVDDGERLAGQLAEAVRRLSGERGGLPVSVSIGVGRVSAAHGEPSAVAVAGAAGQPAAARDAGRVPEGIPARGGHAVGGAPAVAGAQGSGRAAGGAAPAGPAAGGVGGAAGLAGRAAGGVGGGAAAGGSAAGGNGRATGGAAGASGQATGGTRPAGGRPDRLNALLESAAALRAAKASGRDRIARYPGDVERARQRRLLLEARLRTAIETGALDMYAQPLVDLATRRITGFESLARWTDDALGPVSPVEFVPVAEQTGMINALGEYALRATLRQAVSNGLVGRPVELGVNVSPIQLRNRAFAPMVIDLLAECGVRPGQLMLEVTEAIMVDEGDVTSGSLGRLADAGIRLAIDDFGTGYSALSYLRWLPASVIKIDRSWVVASVTDARTRDIVGGVVSLAHTLGATVVMEGIEDEPAAKVCRELGADIGQGWLFGRPGPWPDAAELVTAAERAPAAGAGTTTSASTITVTA